jgi:hypothetical protein
MFQIWKLLSDLSHKRLVVFPALVEMSCAFQFEDG